MNKHIGLSLTALTLIIAAISNVAFASNVTQIERYTTVANKPSAAQINPLLGVQQSHFPTQIKTIGEAVRHWLRYSGYSLVDDAKLSKEARDVLAQPLPQVDRSFGPLTVKEGVEVLAGKGVFHLVQDPLHRKVSLALNSKYKKVFKKTAKRSK